MCKLIFRVKFTCCTVIYVNFSIAWSMLSCSEVNYTVLYFDWFGASVLVYICVLIRAIHEVRTFK